MKSKIEIGQGVFFDIAKLIKTRLLLCANSGGGKSFLIRRIAEQLFGIMPTIIFDVEGEFASLREKFDFVLVGPGGDTPADCRSAKLVIERLLELRASAVIDLSELEPPEKHRYVKLAAQAAINAPKNLWRPTCFVFDEAHEFCPENGKGHSEAKAAVLAFATKGRKRQFLSVFATQRLHKLAFDARAELLNRMIGMTFEPDDLKVAREILGVSGKDEVKAFNKQMRTIEEGNFWTFGRAVCLEPQLLKVGPIQTTHGIEEQKTFAPPPPTAKIRALLPKLADLPKEAEEKAQTEEELRTQIGTLKAALAAAQRTAPAAAPTAPAQTEILQVFFPLLEPAQVDIVRETGKKFEKVIATCEALIAEGREHYKLLNTVSGAMEVVRKYQPAPGSTFKVTQRGKEIAKCVVAPPPGPAATMRVAKVTAHGYTAGPPVHVPPPKPPPQVLNARPLQPFEPGGESPAGKGQWTTHEGEPAAGELAILGAIASYENGLTAPEVSILCDYRKSSRKEYIRKLKARGFIVQEGARYFVTEDGKEALGPSWKPVPRGPALIEYWRVRLSGGELKIFEYALATGQFRNDEQLEAAVTLKKSSRKEFIRQLCARQILERDGPGNYKLAAMFHERKP